VGRVRNRGIPGKLKSFSKRPRGFGGAPGVEKNKKKTNPTQREKEKKAKNLLYEKPGKCDEEA